MDDKAEIINRLTDMQDAIMRAVQYLEADELVKAWHVLQDQEQTNSLKGALDALEKILPEWQMLGLPSEAAHRALQHRDGHPA